MNWRRLGRHSRGVVTAVIALLPLLGGCADPAPLRLLQEEKLAEVEPAGVELAKQTTQDAQTATVTGKPVYAEILRIFAFTGGLNPTQVVQQVAEEAAADGWAGESPRATGFAWFKTIEQRRASLHVAVGSYEGADGLFILLRLQ